MVMITADDFTFLRRAIAIAATAITTGDDPYGSLLAGPLGKILIEAHNTVRRDNDITAHPELKLARWAARELDPDTAARTTMYTSCQPCGMCSGAIARSGPGRPRKAPQKGLSGRALSCWPGDPYSLVRGRTPLVTGHTLDQLCAWAAR